VPRTYIALDLETTGLSADRDVIIEVGMVRFRDGEAVDEFATLINPERPIPSEVQLLTHITNGDVLGKPRFGDVASMARRFAGQLPVVAHNAPFDLAFLRAQGVCNENQGLDTWELASILLPNLPGYSLAALTQYFGISLDHHHRALSDAHAAGQLFNRLSDRAARLPRAVLLEINRLARHSHWSLASVMDEALIASAGVQEATRGPGQELSLEQIAPESPLFQGVRFAEPLARRDPPDPLAVDQVAAMLQPDGAVGQAFVGYEYRPPQIEMLRAVAQAFNQQHHVLAEAGTGTGKSLAYLLPAIAYAVQNSTRVVISTNTINLQDQLFRKDLPDLQRILGAAWGSQLPFRASLLKGRSNYLCPRRLAALKSRPSLSEDEVRGLARILVWLPTTQTGDQSELSLPLPSDRFLWSQVCADNEGCTLDRCQREMHGRCFFYRVRKQADAAHVIIVNHALLLADAATENRVLPEYHHLIIDEAHHLEDAVTDQLSFRADSQLMSQLVGGLAPPGSGPLGWHSNAGGRSAAKATQTPSRAGLLGDMLVHTRSLPEESQKTIRDQAIQLHADVQSVHTRLADFWSVVGEVLRSLQPKSENGDYDAKVRITSSTRTQSVWVEVEVSWDNLSATWQILLKRLATMYGTLQELQEAGFELPGLAGLTEDWSSTLRRLTELYAQMAAWTTKPDANGIYWGELNAQTGRVSVHSAPLHVGPLVQQHILFHNDTVVMTSATLRTAGTFDYVRDRLHAYEADTVTVGSPFDYHESTLLYLPTDLPEPTAPGYQTAVEQTLVGLAKALGGRTLGLFTSYAQLRRTTQVVMIGLAGTGITVLSQSTGTSRHQLLEVFKSASNTILLGTRSFWEGVDVVGPALSALVLVRLPFAVPSDPVVAARSETFDDAFYQYSVPDAILRFRQGFGRLIRSKADRGVVVVLDKRVQTKKYGQLFLDSLPECTVHRGPLMNLPSTSQRWIVRG
jgi:ATP-dependent DNA helicase DinG